MLRKFIFAAACLAGFMPMAARAAASVLQEYNEAVRAKPDLERGAELFRNCAACHGPATRSRSDVDDVPRIAGQHFRVLVRQLVDYRHSTRWDIRMEHIAGHVLGDAHDIASVAAYASELTRDRPRSVGSGDSVDRGARLYTQRCATCHRPAGEGDDSRLIPRLAGQHYEYLLRQMYDAVDGRRPAFPLEHVRLLARLQRDDLVGVADFLARSEWAGPKEPDAAADAAAH